MRWLFRYLLPLVILSCLLAGCWDRVELNDRAIILGWGMDIDEDGQYIASAMVFIPQSNKSTGGVENSSSLSKNFQVFTGTGRSIMEAANKIQPKLSRTIFAGNRRLLVFGEGLARDGLSHILDEYSRNKDVRLRTDMIVVENGNASNLLQMQYALEDSPATGALKIHAQSGLLKDKAMLYFMQSINDYGKSPTLPQISLSGSDQKNKDEMQMTGTAVFDNSLKMKYKLNVEETYYYVWLTKKIDEFNITVPIEDKGIVNIELHHLKSKISVNMVDGQPEFTISLKGNGLIVENETTLHLDQIDNVKLVKEALDLNCVSSTESFLKRIKKEKTDIVGFNGYVHRKYPHIWQTMKKDWSDYFANAPIKVTADLTIRNIGLTGTSLEIEDDPN